MQVVDPIFGAYEPFEHVVHAAEEGDEKVPIEQVEQVDDPPREAVPPKQAMHLLLTSAYPARLDRKSEVNSTEQLSECAFANTLGMYYHELTRYLLYYILDHT